MMTVAGRVDFSLLATFDSITYLHSLRQRWNIRKQLFETYIAALNLTKDKWKREVLLFQVEHAKQEVFYTIPETGVNFATAIEN